MDKLLQNLIKRGCRKSSGASTNVEAGKTQTSDVFSLFLEKVALYQLCEGTRRHPSLVGAEGRTGEPHPGRTTAQPHLSPRIMFLEGRA